MNVFFYVNGLARLVMACAIADEYYAGHRKHLILLHQHGYDYDAILPQVRHLFASVLEFHVANARYSHRYQFLNTYFKPYRSLSEYFTPQSDVVLFDISSPVQKFVVRHNKQLGNRILVFAESLAVDRCFSLPAKHEYLRRLACHLFPRAFAYQHDYDVFYVHVPTMCQDIPYATKLKPIAGLYQSESFSRYASLFTAHLPLDELRTYERVFFGQALSNFHSFFSRAEEEEMLQKIIGEERTLILPHPNERLGVDNKYSNLKNARLLRSGIPNELLLMRLRPKVTATYHSTIGINYAIMAPDSVNHFYPINNPQLAQLKQYARHLDNIRIDSRFVRAV